MPRSFDSKPKTTLTQYARQRKAKEIAAKQEEREAADQRHAYRKNMSRYERQLADLEPERYLRMVKNHDLTFDKELDALARRRLAKR